MSRIVFLRHTVLGQRVSDLSQSVQCQDAVDRRHTSDVFLYVCLAVCRALVVL